MGVRFIHLFILALICSGCSAAQSTTLPDYANTRIKVNTRSAQSASLDARASLLEIKNSREEIADLSLRTKGLKQEILSGRVKLSR